MSLFAIVGQAISVDGVVAALTNLGGFGAMSYVLYTLHTRALLSHEKQLERERGANAEQLKEERNMWSKRFDQVHGMYEKLDTKVEDGFERLGRKLADLQQGREIQASPEYQNNEAAHVKRLRGATKGENPAGGK